MFIYYYCCVQFFLSIIRIDVFIDFKSMMVISQLVKSLVSGVFVLAFSVISAMFCDLTCTRRL